MSFFAEFRYKTMLNMSKESEIFQYFKLSNKIEIGL